ncbi:unnamed protein product, partial [marine sediment metagenome]
PRNLRAILSNVMRERKNAEGDTVPCKTWDNATLLCEVEEKSGHIFPLTAKTQRIAPGETNTWYIRVLGTRFCARFTTKRPKTLETLTYEPGGKAVWEVEDLGYKSVYSAITGAIFEFGFCDAILQMAAAFCDQVAHGPQADLPFGCATTEETRLTHEIFTAALESHRERRTVEIR